MDRTSSCPCQSGLVYEACCAPLHRGVQTASSAEALMRSRYAAYVRQEIDYIVATTVPAQQALLDRAAISAWSRQTEWDGLAVWRHTMVGRVHAQVAFSAYFREAGQRRQHDELSAFVRIGAYWYFIDPTVPLPGMKTACFCGSGKKFKLCCGRLLRGNEAV